MPYYCCAACGIQHAGDGSPYKRMNLDELECLKFDEEEKESIESRMQDPRYDSVVLPCDDKGTTRTVEVWKAYNFFPQVNVGLLVYFFLYRRNETCRRISQTKCRLMLLYLTPPPPPSLGQVRKAENYFHLYPQFVEHPFRDRQDSEELEELDDRLDEILPDTKVDGPELDTFQRLQEKYICMNDQGNDIALFSPTRGRLELDFPGSPGAGVLYRIGDDDVVDLNRRLFGAEVKTWQFAYMRDSPNFERGGDENQRDGSSGDEDGEDRSGLDDSDNDRDDDEEDRDENNGGEDRDDDDSVGARRVEVEEIDDSNGCMLADCLCWGFGGDGEDDDSCGMDCLDDPDNDGHGDGRDDFDSVGSGQAVAAGGADIARLDLAALASEEVHLPRRVLADYRRRAPHPKDELWERELAELAEIVPEKFSAMICGDCSKAVAKNKSPEVRTQLGSAERASVYRFRSLIDVPPVSVFRSFLSRTASTSGTRTGSNSPSSPQSRSTSSASCGSTPR